VFSKSARGSQLKKNESSEIGVKTEESESFWERGRLGCGSTRLAPNKYGMGRH
jgi:hypothetical protein